MTVVTYDSDINTTVITACVQVVVQSVPQTFSVKTRQNRIFLIIQASTHWNVQVFLLAQMEFY